jgi:hypothetical protein
VVNWVMGCLSLASFVVLMNGSASKVFYATRSLRQGCTTSPFLFLLDAERLSRMVTTCKRERSIKGIKMRNSLTLSYLLFIDDIILFGIGSVREAAKYKEIMDLYCKATESKRKLWIYIAKLQGWR